MPEIHGHFAYHEGSITRLVNILKSYGIESRQDLLSDYDVGATARQYEGIKGIGPVLSELLVWLRGQSIDKWRELTGLPAFNHEPEPHSHAGEDWS
jgi:hypothetical protein